ncbi:hypothetical protein GA0115258_12051, partial [Streptomyces sp. LamerLS-31b]
MYGMLGAQGERHVTRNKKRSDPEPKFRIRPFEK